MNHKVLYERIREAFGQTLADPIPVALGWKGADGTEYIAVPEEEGAEPGKFYFHELAGMHPMRGEAYNAGASPLADEYLVYGMPIRVQRDPLSPISNPRWIIQGLDTVLAPEFLAGRPPQAAQPVSLERFMPGMLDQTQPVSMRVRVLGAPYTFGSAFKYIGTQTSANFSDSPVDVNGAPIVAPTQANRAKVVLVQLDFATESLSYKVGTEFNAALTFLQAYALDQSETPGAIIPQPDEAAFRCGYVRLQAGQTVIRRGVHIWTVPEVITKLGGADAAADILGRIVVSDTGVVVSDTGVVWED